MTTASRASLAPWASPRAQTRISELRGVHQEESADAVVTAVERAYQSHHAITDRGSLPMYAGSNVLSPQVAAVHDASLATRPALGLPGEKLQPATSQIEELEMIAAHQVRRAFGARYAEPRYLTATLANLGVYSAFAEPGDTVAILSPEDGSHASHQQHATVGVRGLRTEHLPYDGRGLDVDTTRLTAFVDAVRPRLILVGGSVILFPHDLSPLREAADRVGARLVFDASHVAGLIAAGQFPNPLDAGVDVMTFSTYKTLAGPAGGAAVTNDPEVAERIAHSVYPVLSSNYDAGRLGPLAVAVAEAVDQSPPWARQTVELARELAARLAGEGLVVLGRDRGYTATHQVVVDVGAYGGGTVVMRQLEQCGILVGACRIPDQDPQGVPAGLRIGTQEIVRRGAVADDSGELARLIARAVRNPESVGSDEAARLRHSFGRDIWGR